MTENNKSIIESPCQLDTSFISLQTKSVLSSLKAIAFREDKTLFVSRDIKLVSIDRSFNNLYYLAICHKPIIGYG